MNDRKHRAGWDRGQDPSVLTPFTLSGGCGNAYNCPVTHELDRLQSALADRRAIERELH
jgi:hypothetical protein